MGLLLLLLLVRACFLLEREVYRKFPRTEFGDGDQMIHVLGYECMGCLGGGALGSGWLGVVSGVALSFRPFFWRF